MVEQAGNLSVIRIQDRVQLAGITDAMQPQPLNSLWLVISLKAGEMNGTYTLTVIPVKPSGEEVQGFPSFNVLFEGNERGTVVAFPIPLVVTEEGLYWFQVRLQGVLLTELSFE